MKIFTLKSVALLAALAGSLAAATVSAQERVRISFVRAGATADEVAVLLSDEDGQPIPGAKATLTLSHELKTTGTAVTPSVLCPDANATGGQDVTFQLDITGLEPGFAFDRVQLEAHALNSSGAYQAEGQVREWNLTTAQGADAASLADFAALTDYDLNNAHPALPVLEAETPATAGASLSLRLTASKGTDNGGCFFGLSRIVLYDSAEGGPEAAGPQDEAGTTAFMVDLSHGNFTALNGNGTYARTWSSTAQEPGLTLSTDRNDMAAAGSAIDCYATSGGSTYTLTASEGYAVLSYCFDFTNAGAQNMTVTPANGTAVTCSGNGAARIDVQGLDERTASFTVTSANGSTAAARTARFFVKVAPGGAPAEAYTELFVSRSGGIPYRIPAIARTHDGSLLALSDYRPCKADIGNGHVDIVGRISTDNGQTWGEAFTVADGSGIGGRPDTGYGDAALVADHESDRVLLICAAGNVVYGSSTRQNPIRVARLYSEDNGRTWSAPADITEALYSLFDGSSLGDVNGLFFGSGRICQSRYVKVGEYYRLYAALCARPGGNRVVYSDDFGETWHALGTTDVSPAGSGDEPKCEELPDGSVLLSSRKSGGRYYNIFSYTDVASAEGYWGQAVASESYEGGVSCQNNSTNGEILIIPARRNADGANVYVALQSLPLGPGRANVGLYWKVLEQYADFSSPATFAAGWDGRHQSSYLNSAYSTMTMQANDSIAFFYEERLHDADYTLVYKQYSLEGLTDGAYSYAPQTEDRAAFMRGAEAEQRLESVVFTGYVGTATPDARDGLEAALAQFARSGSLDDCAAFNRLLAASTVRLEEGRWYRLRNVGRQNATLYLVPGASTLTVERLDASDADQLFTFRAGAGNTWTLYSGNAAAFAGATQAVEQETPLAAAASAGTFLVQSPIDGKSALICTNGANATYNALHLAADCRRLVPWTSGEDGSRWYIEPVDAQQLEVAGGWATANYPFAVELPDGVKAYAATDFGTVGDERPALRLAEVSGAVPACTPVLVEAAEGTYSLPIVADAPAVEDNLLSGTLRSAAVESASLYLLDTADASPVMRLRRTATGNVASNQAYFLAPDSQAEAYVLTTDELVTGIGGVTTEADAPTVYYDLSGRRVKQPARGVYVTADGRKVILK